MDKDTLIRAVVFALLAATIICLFAAIALLYDFFLAAWPDAASHLIFKGTALLLSVGLTLSATAITIVLVAVFVFLCVFIIMLRSLGDAEKAARRETEADQVIDRDGWEMYQLKYGDF